MPGYVAKLYQHDNFKGYEAVFPPGNHNMAAFLAKGAKNDDISSIIVEKYNTIGAILYQHGDFTGWKAVFPEGRYTLADIIANGGKNDDASSINVMSGYVAKLYQHDNFQGYEVVFPPGNHNIAAFLAKGAQNDDVSSIIVERYNASIHGLDAYGCSTNYKIEGVDNHTCKIDMPNCRGHISNVQWGDCTNNKQLDHIKNTGCARPFIKRSNKDKMKDRYIHDMCTLDKPICGGYVANQRWGICLQKKIGLKSHHGKYLSAQSNGTVMWNRNWILGWEYFDIIQKGNKIAIKSVHGKFLSAQPNGTVQWNKDRIGSWEQFEVERINYNQIVLKSVHGKYLSAQPDGKVEWNRDIIGSWEKFIVEEIGAIVYEHADYKGWKVNFSVGEFNLPNIEARGGKNDQISSLKVMPGYRAKLYEHADFKGKEVIFTPGNYNFKDFLKKGAKNDDISSIKVELYDERYELSNLDTVSTSQLAATSATSNTSLATQATTTSENIVQPLSTCSTFNSDTCVSKPECVLFSLDDRQICIEKEMIETFGMKEKVTSKNLLDGLDNFNIKLDSNRVEKVYNKHNFNLNENLQN